MHLAVHNGKSFPMYIPFKEPDVEWDVFPQWIRSFDSLVAEWLVDRLRNTSNPCFHCIQEDFHPFD